MKRRLIINTLPEDKPAASSALEVHGTKTEEVRVIHTAETKTEKNEFVGVQIYEKNDRILWAGL